jgi:hypothetical protein
MAQKTTVTLSLDTEADKDILSWLNRQENRSAAVRGAIRDHLGNGGVTIGDVYQVVKTIERRIEAGVLVAGNGEPEAVADEPPEAAAALDALAAMGG